MNVSNKILVANGVNLDLLGQREEKWYGRDSLNDIQVKCQDCLDKIQESSSTLWQMDFFQSNSEASFLEKLNQTYSGMVINAGAWTHTSLALADRLSALQVPFVEVHMSQIAQRSAFRHHSYLSRHAIGVIFGFGSKSYLLALDALINHLENSKYTDTA